MVLGNAWLLELSWLLASSAVAYPSVCAFDVRLDGMRHRCSETQRVLKGSVMSNSPM